MVAQHDPVTADHQSYDARLFAPLFATEDRHFWFRARNRVITALIEPLLGDLPAGYRVMEVGCGTGNVLRVLEQVCATGAVVGMDLFAQGLQYARRRTVCPLVQGDVRYPAFQVPFDVVGLFDVLEHIPDDRQTLRDIHRLLTPHGALVLTVPAHPSLWSYFDEGAHHCRRYEYAELEAKLVETGYEIEYLTPYMVSIFPLVWAGRRLTWMTSRLPGRRQQQAYDLKMNDYRIMPVANDVLTWLLYQEAHAVARRQRLPFGTSLLALARKQHAS